MRKVRVVEQDYEGGVTVLTDYYEISDEDLAVLKRWYTVEILEDIKTYIDLAKERKEVYEKRHAKDLANKIKKDAEKEKKARERKRKQLEKLKAELEES